MSDLSELTLVSGPSEARLNRRQLVDYRDQRKNCLRWLLTFGKDPDTADGYAFETVKARGNRMDIFYRWVWEQEDRYTADVTHEHADDFLYKLAYENSSNANKSNYRKSLMMLYKWRQYEHGLEEYEPALTFSSTSGTTNPRDYLSQDERGKIREAALEYGSIPSYKGLAPDARNKWKAYLAQRFEKPKAEVTPDDWDRANGWKIPSLVWVSLDAGLRPIEVKRAVTDWVDVENGVLRIPKEQSSKNRDNWIVGLRDRTADVLNRWLKERKTYEMYSETKALWLTREGNSYEAGSLRYLLHQLCGTADISTENRQMSWYAIRHSVGTYMTREEDLAAAQTQLRHKSPKTTMKYDQVPVEDRKNALERMG